MNSACKSLIKNYEFKPEIRKEEIIFKVITKHPLLNKAKITVRIFFLNKRGAQISNSVQQSKIDSKRNYSPYIDCQELFSNMDSNSQIWIHSVPTNNIRHDAEWVGKPIIHSLYVALVLEILRV